MPGGLGALGEAAGGGVGSRGRGGIPFLGGWELPGLLDDAVLFPRWESGASSLEAVPISGGMSVRLASGLQRLEAVLRTGATNLAFWHGSLGAAVLGADGTTSLVRLELKAGP